MDAQRLAARFPLVARPRPACLPLDVRVREVAELARGAAGHIGSGGLALAATAHNKAALIASDASLPDLARSLCWRQFDVYERAARPLGAQAARYMLEPIVNLARLQIRDGDGAAAYHLLDTLHRAVRSRTDAVIDGRHVCFRDLTTSDEDHRTLCQWLWTVHLADGTRALTSAGRWADALAHVEQHNGVGQRLLDGRQVAVLARALAGASASAAALLDESTLPEPWEQAVAACLSVLCLTVCARPAAPAVAVMVERYLALEPAPEFAVFRARLGLTVIDLAGTADQPDAARAVAARLICDTAAAKDGYTSRDVLAHDRCRRWLTDGDERALTAAVWSSGLDRGSIDDRLMTDLLAATQISEAVTARHRGRHSRLDAEPDADASSCDARMTRRSDGNFRCAADHPDQLGARWADHRRTGRTAAGCPRDARSFHSIRYD